MLESIQNHTQKFQKKEFGNECQSSVSNTETCWLWGGKQLSDCTTTSNTPLCLQDSKATTWHWKKRKLAEAAKERVGWGAGGVQISKYNTRKEVVVVVGFLCGCVRCCCCCCCWANQYFYDVATQATANDSKHHEKIWEQEGERNEKDKKRTVK